MKGIDTQYFLMDAGSVVWHCNGPVVLTSGQHAELSFGSALGQLRAQLTECGRVVDASDLAPDDLPSCATPCDFVVLRHGLFRWGYVTVRLEESCDSWLVTFQASARNVSARLLRDILRHLQ